MEMRRLGRTGLRVAALCLGGNTFGWTTDQPASEAVLDAYVEAGGNFIDTADVYSRWVPGNSGGESEIALGGDELADIAFAGAVGVVVGGVDEVAAGLDECLEHLAALIL